MTLPTSNIKFSQINTELYRTANQSLNADNADVRRLAFTGNTGQNQNSATQIRISNLLGRARFIEQLITTSVQNPNLRTSAVAAGRYASGLSWVSCEVGSGGIIGSSSITVPSLTTSFFKNGEKAEKTLAAGAYVVGRGGNGGDGRPGGSAGQAGGTAIEITIPTRINNLGIIGGGGGGGGGGDDDEDKAFTDAGSGGGGGAGFLAGAGGEGGQANSDGNDGNAGTLTTGGTGGSGVDDGGQGGDGGALGQAGQVGGNGGTEGGAAGTAIFGNVLVSYTNFGDIRGPRI